MKEKEVKDVNEVPKEALSELTDNKGEEESRNG